jgi:tetratricopeptide (TPR) repeat protein
MRHDETINRGPGEGKARDRPLPPPWAIPGSLAVLLLAAALFRAVYFYLYAQNSIFFDGLILDSRVYDSWAAAIARGQWVGREAFYFPPLYPYLLGVLFKGIGHSLAPVYLLQALLGLVNLLLIHRIGLATFNERVGLLAAGAAALYGPLAFFEMKVLGTTLGLTLGLLALVLLVGAERAQLSGRAVPGRWLLAGLVIGLAAECVPGTILLAPLYGAYLGLTARARAALVLLAGTFLATMPVLSHNLYVASDPLPLSGQGGLTFYQGNNPSAVGIYSVAPGFSGSPESQAVEEQSIAEHETGRIMRRSEVSAHFLRKGLAYIASSPLAWLRLEGRKLLALCGDYEASTEYSLYYERQQIPWLRILCLPFAAILAAGAAGMILAGRPRPPARALLLYGACAAAIPMIFYVSGRYRLPLVPPLLIYGAAFGDRLWTEIRATGALSPAAARTAALALGLALVSFFPLGRPVVSAEANVHYNIGNLLMERNRYEEAIASFDRSLAQWPGNDYAWINRGNSLDKLGRPDEALASYVRAEEANPGSWRAYKAQGIILHRSKRYDEEEEVYRRGLKTDGEEAYYLLGVALKNLNRIDEATRAFQAAIRLNPTYARAHTRLAEILAGLGQTDQARAEFQKALSLDPDDKTARTGLGRLGG